MKTHRTLLRPTPGMLLVLLLFSLASAVRADSSLLLSLVAPMPQEEASTHIGTYPFVDSVEVLRLVDGRAHLLVVHLTATADMGEALETLAADPLVGIVQENHRMSLDALPTDPLLERQWGLENEEALGWNQNMETAADIEAIAAWQIWDIQPGDNPVVVAVIDSGVELDHPDLDGQLVPPGDWKDYVDGDATPDDSDGHGTLVARIIAAAWDGDGMAGVCPQCRILPVRVTAGQTFDVENLIRGIDWALSHGAQVINISAGTDAWQQSSPLLRATIQDARNQGIAIVTAAGNDGHRGISLPAIYPETIAVGAVDRYGDRASFSNQGSELDLTAPGVDVLTGDPDTGSGTSFSAPHVTGLVGLLLSGEPNLTPDQLRERLLRSTDDGIGAPGQDISGPDALYGWGVPNAVTALDELLPGPLPGPVTGLAVEIPQSLANDAYDAGRVRLTWDGQDAASSYRIYRADAPQTPVAHSAGAPWGEDAAAPGGRHSSYLVAALDADGNSGGSTAVEGPYVPAMPGSVSASMHLAEQILVDWNPVAEAAHYRVYSSPDDARPSLLGTVVESEFSDTNAVPTIIYRYRVSAVTAEGQEGPLSDPVTGFREHQALSAPENLQASTNNSSGVALSWDAVDGAMRYWIQRADDPQGPWSNRDFVDSTAWLDSTAANSTTYWYRVRAEDSAHLFSPYSDAVSGSRKPPVTKHCFWLWSRSGFPVRKCYWY